MGIGFAYLSVIMDAYSRKIVGWSFHKTLEAKGPVAALEMALKTRDPSDQSLIHHSDRGVQYCSGAYVDRLRQATITISMTESGDPTGSPERRECSSGAGFSDLETGPPERKISIFGDSLLLPWPKRPLSRPFRLIIRYGLMHL